MSSSRVWGALLCVASAFVSIIHIYYGYITGGQLKPPQGWAFALPVTVIVLVATGLAFWLGWIMMTTKESSTTAEEGSVEEETEVEEEE